MIKAATYGAGRANLRKALSERLPFSTSGALRGEAWTREFVSNWNLGRLDRDEANRFMIDHLAGITYVVWSYGTPIAWVRTDGAVYCVQQRFSPTTSKHQGMCYMLSTLGG